MNGGVLLGEEQLGDASRGEHRPDLLRHAARVPVRGANPRWATICCLVAWIERRPACRAGWRPRCGLSSSSMPDSGHGSSIRVSAYSAQPKTAARGPKTALTRCRSVGHNRPSFRNRRTQARGSVVPLVASARTPRLPIGGSSASVRPRRDSSFQGWWMACLRLTAYRSPVIPWSAGRSQDSDTQRRRHFQLPGAAWPGSVAPGRPVLSRI